MRRTGCGSDWGIDTWGDTSAIPIILKNGGMVSLAYMGALGFISRTAEDILQFADPAYRMREKYGATSYKDTERGVDFLRQYKPPGDLCA